MARLACVLVVGLVAAGCRSLPPQVPAVPVLRKVVIAIDVRDDVLLCVQPTAWMIFDDPGLVGPVCIETVGQFRDRVRRERWASQ